MPRCLGTCGDVMSYKRLCAAVTTLAVQSERRAHLRRRALKGVSVAGDQDHGAVVPRRDALIVVRLHVVNVEAVRQLRPLVRDGLQAPHTASELRHTCAPAHRRHSRRSHELRTESARAVSTARPCSSTMRLRSLTARPLPPDPAPNPRNVHRRTLGQPRSSRAPCLSAAATDRTP